MKFVWNEEKVFIDGDSKNGTYEFENFDGFIKFRGSDCQVRNAAFTVIIRHIEYLTGKHRPAPPQNEMVNEIVWKDGEVVSGNFYPHYWQGGTFNGTLLNTEEFENGTFNGEKLVCQVFGGGTVSRGAVECGCWERGTFSGESFAGTFCCGVFNGGIFTGTWRDGHFRGGIFRGNWKGGTWFGGSFEGKSWVGDGTFDSVVKG